MKRSLETIGFVCLALAAVLTIGMLVLWWASPIVTQMQLVQFYWFGYLVVGALIGVAVGLLWR